MVKYILQITNNLLTFYNNVSIFDSIILLPCSIEEINKQIEITASKRKFSKRHFKHTYKA